MCYFFSFVTEPEKYGGKRFYFNWKDRKKALEMNMKDVVDSHSWICSHFRLNEDECNKYEYDPFTKVFLIDQTNSSIDDSVAAEEWVKQLDFKRIMEPIIYKNMVDPVTLPTPTLTARDFENLDKWKEIVDNFSYSNIINEYPEFKLLWDAVSNKLFYKNHHYLITSFKYVKNLYVAYLLSFYTKADLNVDITCAIELWERGVIPVFSDNHWTLHSGNSLNKLYSTKLL